MRDPRASLRLRVYVVIGLVVLAPLAFVWATNVADATLEQRMRLTLQLAAQRAAARIEKDSLQAADPIARTYAVRLRVIGDGAVLHDIDAERTWLGRAGDVLFREDGAPTLAEHDATLPPVGERPEVRAGAASVGCAANPTHTLLVCHAVRPLADGRVVYVQQSTRRSIRALYDARYQLLKMTLGNLALAGLLGLWLGFRIVGPIETLRRRVLARVDRPVVAAPLAIDRRDEIGDLARAFDALFQAVVDRARANEAFVADLAHEMKNPVAAVRAVAESLDGPQDADRARRLARVLSDSSRRLDALVTGLLELARAEAGLPGEERASVDLAALARGVADAVRNDPRWERIHFEVEAAPVIVTAIPGRLEAALLNLVVNAAAFAASKVQIRVRSTPTGARIEVRDDGPGVAEADLPRLFDRFHTRREGGTGLGLPLARAVVEAHGGALTARNDGGAVFTLDLPDALRQPQVPP